MTTIVPYLIAVMAIIGVFLFGKYLYRKLYLRKYVLKDLEDINNAFAALAKKNNEIVHTYNHLAENVDKLTRLVEHQRNQLKKLQKEHNDTTTTG